MAMYESRTNYDFLLNCINRFFKTSGVCALYRKYRLGIKTIIKNIMKKICA